VLIGVARAGNLDPLQAVHDGVSAMEKWALAQGIERERVLVLSDESGPVEVHQVKKAIKKLIDLSIVEQLIVYFAGHGVNISRGEVWLLSGAPEDSNEAVNVSGSVELARFCGIPHVVLISDACRTAAEGIQAQGIRGSEIFPNLDSVTENPVDLFFACGLGSPALEVKDPKQTAAGFRAVYTDSLVEALEGRKDVLVNDPEKTSPIRLIEVAATGEPRGIIRPFPLSVHLQTEVLDRLISADVKPGVSQMPHARIVSRGTWLAEVAPSPPPEPLLGRRRSLKPQRPKRKPRISDGERGAGKRRAKTAPARAAAPVENLIQTSRSLLKASLEGGPVAPAGPSAFGAGAAGAAGAGELFESVSRVFAAFGPAAFETQCGFKVRGTAIDSVMSATAEAQIVDPERRIVRVDAVDGPAANLLIQFENGTGVVLPAIPEYIGAITVESGEVANVTYEPSENSVRWSRVEDRLGELRSLRALMAASARLGVFHLKGDDAALLAERIKVGEGLDPTMAVYAAYAYHELQQKELIGKIQRALLKDLSLRLFDVELVSGDLRGRSIAGQRHMYPFVPLLDQGWALLSAHRVQLPPKLEKLGRHLVESLWTLFDPPGVELIRTAIQDKEIA
jgi:hypothetical protein